MQITTNTLHSSFNFTESAINIAKTYLPNLIGAVLAYIIGSLIIKWIMKVVTRIMTIKHVDSSLQSFLLSFIKIILTILLLLTVFGMLGVNLTSFAAILAGLAVGVGAALNGTLGNFAGGVMMLLFKPFKVGDIIETQGQTGEVKEMGVFNTILLTPENKTVILANGPVSTGTIVNYATQGSLRVDLYMAVDPATDIAKAKAVALAAIKSVEHVLATPAPEVTVSKVGDGMVTLAIRPYTTQANYWDVYFGATEAVKVAFDKNDIDEPTPTRFVINK